MKKKNRRDLCKVIVEIIDERKETENSVREYDIPKGCECCIEMIGGDMKIKDSTGNILKHVRWQAGFSQEYDFIYRD